MTVLCPLSGSDRVVLLEKIPTDSLIEMYQKKIGDSIHSEFADVREIGFYHCVESDLKFFYPMVTGSELFYEKLQQIDWYYLDEKKEYQYAAGYIRESDEVLEIGCGKGAFAEKIAAKSYIGLEFSRQAQALAAEKNIKVLTESIEQHAANHSEQYSVVCSFQVLEHVAEIHSFVEASVECLKPGGLLIYTVPSADSFVASIKNYVLNMPPHHLSWWSDKSLYHISELFGLKVVDAHHEKLADIHKQWYSYSILIKALENITKYKSNKLLIDRSLPYRLMSIASVLGSKLLEKGLADKGLPDGHSVTYVYQKPES